MLWQRLLPEGVRLTKLLTCLLLLLRHWFLHLLFNAALVFTSSQRLNPRAIETYYMGEIGPGPCEALARWRKFAFTKDDVWLSTSDNGPGHVLEVERIESAYVLRFAGQVRTVVRKPFELVRNGEELPMDDASYKLCLVDEIEGSARDYPDRLAFLINDVCELVRGGNPTIDLDGIIDLPELNILDFSDLSSSKLVINNQEQTRGGDLLLLSSVDLPDCNGLPSVYDNDGRAHEEESPVAYRYNMGDTPIFARLPGTLGGFAIHDPRLILKENTAEMPLADGGGKAVLRSAVRSKKGHKLSIKTTGNKVSQFEIREDESIVLCAAAYPNFINVDNCKLSDDADACYRTSAQDDIEDVKVVVTLDSSTLNTLNQLLPRSISVIEDSTFDNINDQLPCSGVDNPRSRWILTDRSEGSCVSSIHPETKMALSEALANSNDLNEEVRDIHIFDGDLLQCHPNDVSTYGMSIYVEGQCWENVQPDYRSVFNAASGTYLGRVGDVLEVEELARKLTLIETQKAPPSEATASIIEEIANTVGYSLLAHKVRGNRGGRALVCGSEGEIAPDPTLDDYFDVQQNYLNSVARPTDYGEQKKNVWTLVALKSKDQLRQRMAWALYQHMNVATTLTVQSIQNEANLIYYDSFVRNSFGQFRDLLKEVAFSSRIGEQFTFYRGTSARFSWEIKEHRQYPGK